MSYTTEIKTQWFPMIRDAVPGLETTVGRDGTYDGDNRLIKAVWLIEFNGTREKYSKFCFALSFPTCEAELRVTASPSRAWERKNKETWPLFVP